MKSPIHQTESERLQATTQSSVSAIQETTKKVGEVVEAVHSLEAVSRDKSTETEGFTSVKDAVDKGTKTLEQLKNYIDHPEVVVRKLEEVKSASLITNKLLKDISNKKEKEYPASMKMEITNKPNEMATAFFSMLKGEEGKPGKPGMDGKDGKNGIAGRDGKDGERGLAGKNGNDGKDGQNGTPGRDAVDGNNGKDGSPDTPDEVVNKINQAEKKIDPKQVRGLSVVMRQVNEYGTNPQGRAENVGGAQPLIMLSNGVRVSDFITEINFSTNITAIYSGGGRMTLTATGGSSSTFSETPTGAIDGSNKSYTTLNSITTVINLVINGMFIHPAEYTVSGAGFTMITALDSSLSGKGFTIIYS